jgi:hypothetical protein
VIPSLGLSLILPILCLVHLMRNGRNQMWIMPLIFLPVIGAAAYFIVEILPGLQGNRHIRTARAAAVSKLDPEREVRSARSALDLTDTTANRIRLADALAELGKYDEALPLYREAIARGPADRRTAEKLARAQYETGDAATALETLDASDPPSAQFDRDRQGLLRARVLDQLGRKDEALALYADLVTRVAGEEARCRYAALLIETGWDKKALVVLEEVEQRMKVMDRHQRAAEAEMYRWAMERLAELRAKRG